MKILLTLLILFAIGCDKKPENYPSHDHSPRGCLPIADLENAVTESALLECAIKGQSFKICGSDILDMSKKEMIQLATLMKLAECGTWGVNDPNEVKRIERHLIDELVPDRYKIGS